MKWPPLAVFVLVLAGHFFYVTGDVPASSGKGPWASFEFDAPEESRLLRYVNAGDHWLGLSYALAGTFGTWCFLRMVRMRREALAASAGGLTMSGVIWAGVCFLTGCCGSPMLPLYLGLFGPRFMSVTKPLTFGLTLLSIVVGYAWMLKRAQKAIEKNVNARLHETAGADAGQV